MTSCTSGPWARERQGGPPIETARTSFRRTFCIVLLTVALVLMTFAGAGEAYAEPQDITQAKSEADVLRARVADLNNKLEVLVEDYNTAVAQLEQTKAAAAETQATLKQSQKDLSAAQGRLGDRLVQFYKRGRLSFLDALLGANSFGDLATRIGLLARVGQQDGQLVNQVTAYRDLVKERRTTLAKQQQQQTELASAAEASKQAVQAQLSENQRLLAGKEQQIAELEAEEQARQAELAAQAKVAAEKAAQKAAAQKAAALEAEAKAKQAQLAGSAATTTTTLKPAGEGSETTGSTKNTTTTVRADDSDTSDQTDDGSAPSSGNGAAAVEIAMQYLGVPYVWAGANPSGFDCSGLVMYVYAKLGVDLPHSSRMQYDCGTHVSRSELEPGDLVFFGSPIHHVGMYVGDGNMINAPYTGVTVRIESMDRSDYVGATRVI
jgi:peptidoglycan DL-endopeptidase CwlO